MAALMMLFSIQLSAQELNKNYDAALAEKLKGNDNGMKMYVLVILKTGANNIADKAKRDEVFAGHMMNIGRLAHAGELIMAGPLGKNDLNYRGIFIFNTESVEKAKELVMTDPAVKENVFDYELFPFFGSAAIQETVNIHNRITKYKQ